MPNFVPKPLSLVLFDCDGTLVDSQYAIVSAMTTALRWFGLPDPDPRAVRRVVGLSLVQAVARLLPELDGPQHEAIAGRYKQAFHDQRQAGSHPEPLFAGLVPALDAIEAAGVLLGIATGKSRRGLVATLEHHGLLGRFVTLQTADSGPGKPHPDMVYRALAETGVDPRNAVVVGDTTYDIQMARNARVGAVGVSWGYHEAAELTAAGARILCDGYEQVPDAVAAALAAHEELGIAE